MEEEEGLEGGEVAWLEEEPLEVRIESALHRVVPRCKYRDVVVSDDVLQSRKQESFLHQLGQFRVMRVEESHEDGIRVDSADAGGGIPASLSRRRCGDGEQEEEEGEHGGGEMWWEMWGGFFFVFFSVL